MHTQSIPQFKKSLINLFLAFAVIASLALGAASPAAAQSGGPSDPAELEAYLDGVMTTSMAEHHVPGAVISVVKDGQVFFAKGYGYANLENKVPVDPAITLFRPGSVSKLFVWTAVMQMVEQGKLSLDADVNTYLDFEIPATYSEPITLKHLMTHTPGFEDKTQGLFIFDPAGMTSLEIYLKENIPARVFAPGQIPAYSNYGSALAAYIVERISGMPFMEYVEQAIFNPLEMNHATFRQPLPAEMAGNMANGYSYSNGKYYQGEFEIITAYPAGALSATGLDMANFMIAHLQNGRYGEARILQEETAVLMHSELNASDPRIDGMAHGFFENEIHEQYTVSHGGDTILFHSLLLLLPESNTGLFISTNGSTGDQTVQAVRKAFMDRYYPAETPALVPTTDFSSRAAKYAGEFYMARSNYTSMEKLISAFTPVNVTIDENQQVIVNVMGQVMRFVETEPGLLVNVEDPDMQVVLKEESGQVYLHVASPMTMAKAPWYRTAPVSLLIFAGGALLFAISVICWLVSFTRGLIRREKRPAAARLARLAAGLFGLVFLFIIGALGSAFMDMNPAYGGMPNIVFASPPWMDSVLKAPLPLAVLGVAMLGFTVLAWAKRLWNASARLHYTLLTVFAGAIVWAMVYWKLWMM
ncbi:MAG: beta-lactamase family protein [Anaerolineaceae bacterium]|nr:beta-lactamase family protein [Anaerolineaceae bacterium]